MFVWNRWAVASLLVGLVSVTLAVIVLRARSRRLQSQYLALALFFSGLDILLWQGLPYALASPQTAYASFVASAVAAPWAHISYLLFPSTLATPLARPLTPWAVRTGLAPLAAAVSIYVLLNPERLVTGFEVAWFARWEARCGDAGLVTGVAEVT